MAKDFRNFPDPPNPPGIVNNNPGNIRPDGTNWQGMAGARNNFIVFSDTAWGLRAMGTDLANKISEGNNTITKIITKYSPVSDNTAAIVANYIASVATSMGIGKDQPLSLDKATLKALMKAQMKVELGSPYYTLVTDADIDEGLAKMSPNIIAKIKNFFQTTRK